MQFGILVPQTGFDHIARHCRLADDLGYDVIAIGDSPLVFREMYVSLSVAAMETKSAGLLTCVSNPITRHIVVTASAAGSLWELSKGRIKLGIGSGDSAVYSIGKCPATRKEIRAFVTDLRTLFHGGSVKLDNGKSIEIPWANYDIPIYISAEGPKMQKLAGMLADGVILGSGLSNELIHQSLANIEEGALESGRNLRDLDIWLYTRIAIGEDRNSLIEEISSGLAASINRIMRRQGTDAMIPEDMRRGIERIQAEYNYGHHMQAGDITNLLSAKGSGDIVRYLASRFSLLGQPDTIAKRISEIKRAGINRMLISGNVREPASLIDIFMKEVVPDVKVDQ